MNMINIISKGNLKKNKTKSILIIVSIALTTCLLVSVGIIGKKFTDSMKGNAIARSGAFHSRYRGVSGKQLEELKNNLNISKLGEISNLGNLINDNVEMNISYINEEYSELTNLEIKEGKLPEQENEILISDGYLNLLNYSEKLGQEIELEYEVEDKIIKDKFKIVGIIESKENEIKDKKFSAAISKERLLKDKGNENKYTAFVKLDNEKSLKIHDIEFLIKEIGANLKIEEEKILLNNDYITYMNPSTSTKIAQIIVIIIVLLAAILVIYNIFYFSVISKIKDYGKLRAIGATKKQIKKIILREGLFLSSIAIPIGAFLGLLIGEGILSSILKEPLSFGLWHIFMVILATMITLVAVVISLIKPMKVAANISPVEAMRYSESVLGNSKRNNCYEEMNLSKLTKANLFRNKKRTLITIVSMSLSGIIFIVASVVMLAFDPEAMAREHNPYDFRLALEDYSFGNNLSSKEDTLPLFNELQINNPLSDKLIEELRNDKNIKEINENFSMRGEMIYPEIELKEFNNISSFKKEDEEKLNETVKEGNFNSDEYIRDNGIAFGYASFRKEYGNLQLGDKVKLRFFDGDKVLEKEFTIKAITNEGALFILPEEILKSLAETNIRSSIGINVKEEYQDEMKSFLMNLDNNNKNLKFLSLEDSINLNKEANKVTLTIGYGLIIVIFMISLMNFVNTLITSAISRKKEFAMLQAIGLSNKQLEKILKKESMIYIGITMIFTVFIGNLFGIFAIEIMKNTGMNYAKYNLPIVETLMLILILIGMQVVINKNIIKQFHKESVIDRIRYND